MALTGHLIFPLIALVFPPKQKGQSQVLLPWGHLASLGFPNPSLFGLRLGRKAPLVWSYLQLAVSGAATAYVGSFSAYCVFRFLMGMTFSGIILNSLSLGESSSGGIQRGWGQEEGELQPS